jgi:hypothetical protein
MLTKQYKGLELKQPVRLLECAQTTVTLQVTDPLLIPLLEGSVYLHGEAFPQPVCGRIQDYQSAERIFHLAEITEIDWLARQSERVQPAEPVYIRIHGKPKLARLRLADLSVSGIGIVAAPSVCAQAKLVRDQEVKLDFTLSGISFTNLPARVLYQSRLGQWLQKIGLSLTPTSSQLRHLKQYVAGRKAEILEEVIQIYQHTRQPHSIESLYF